MARRIYLDNSSTSWPKAPGIGDVIKTYLEENGSNTNRGTYQEAFSVMENLLETREELASFFNTKHSENVVFTMNVTQAINFVIKGYFTKEDHVIVSSLEHNAVMRPLVQCGIPFSRIPADRDGNMDISAVPSLITERTKAIIVTGISNVCGVIHPLDALSEIAKKHKLLFIVDGAQSLPYFPITLDMADAILFTGHKGFLGPQGVGGMVLSSFLAENLDPLISGGTGSMSDSEEIPPFMPDRFESGTQNLPGLIGFGSALSYVLKNREGLKKNELLQTERLLEGLKSIDKIRIVGPSCIEKRGAVISIDAIDKDNAVIADILSREFGIETRVGLHCAPNAHKTLGTFPHGTIRFSPGPFTKEEDIDDTLTALRELFK
ncbi:MAG: aminotransferase class V-fold PLP-dependent enzyme [Sphaerochaetaceae bacterium]|nr:aminotransferase class V-fold PLP-dependent enzyme [Sphaerochaetaceae bacterium]